MMLYVVLTAGTGNPLQVACQDVTGAGMLLERMLIT